MTKQELITNKNILLDEVAELISEKKRKYAHMSIETSMSSNEKILSKKIANIYSQINAVVKEIHKADKIASKKIALIDKVEKAANEKELDESISELNKLY